VALVAVVRVLIGTLLRVSLDRQTLEAVAVAVTPMSHFPVQAVAVL
jgi:hypothetical protein